VISVLVLLSVITFVSCNKDASPNYRKELLQGLYVKYLTDTGNLYNILKSKKRLYDFVFCLENHRQCKTKIERDARSK